VGRKVSPWRYTVQKLDFFFIFFIFFSVPFDEHSLLVFGFAAADLHLPLQSHGLSLSPRHAFLMKKLLWGHKG
jgi:hypothetical protein